MDFAEGLIARIKKQIGLELASDEAFSILKPTGNDHLVQFIFKNLAEEYLELDPWDRHHLFLSDITKGLDFEFELDENGEFAYLKPSIQVQAKPIEAIMDLRDDYLIIIYYYGDAKVSHRLNQHLLAADSIHPCHVGTVIFEQLICELDSINRIEYEFEQNQSMHIEPVVLKGCVNGDLAQTVYAQHLNNFKQYFNIKSICGLLTDNAQGNTIFCASGSIQMDDCKLSDSIKIANQLYLLLRMKYKNLVESCLVAWDTENSNKCSPLSGNLIEIWFTNPIDKLDGLLKFFTRGDKNLLLFGVTERVSRKLWSVKAIQVDSGARVELELASNMVRIYLMGKNSIPVLDRIEEYLQRHVTVDFENLAY